MKEKAVAELDPVLTKAGFTKAVEMIYEDMGSNMAKTLGVEKFGGNVQTAGVKKAGYSYWCTANKDMYLCKTENSLNYIDNSYFEAFSNASLLGKLQNLDKNFIFFEGLKPITSNGYVFQVDKNYNFITMELCWTSGYPDETFPIKVPTQQKFATLPVYNNGVLKAVGKFENYPNTTSKISNWSTETGYYIRRITYSNN